MLPTMTQCAPTTAEFISNDSVDGLMIGMCLYVRLWVVLLFIYFRPFIPSRHAEYKPMEIDIIPCDDVLGHFFHMFFDRMLMLASGLHTKYGLNKVEWVLHHGVWLEQLHDSFMIAFG